MLRLEKIDKSYQTGEFVQHALKGVSLEFRESEFVAILGQSGSGKTTMLNVIGGLDRYDNGDLIINQKSTKEFKDRDWDAYRNNSVGFVFQNYNLITHISILDNVEMGMALSGVSRGERKKRALEVLEKVGLKEHAHKKPGQLSGGQMQRVAIARALVNNPDIILADEPTGALDSQTSVQIMNLITEIAKDKLVIMVTHNAELAKKYANRIIELKDGVVTYDSNPVKEIEREKTEYSLKKTAMSFQNALNLSFNNILTKKGRTILTAFAASIGIIGIALILSLSNGFDKQIDKFELETLSSFPIMISRQAMEVDMEKLKENQENFIAMGNRTDEYLDKKEVYPYDSKEQMAIHTNRLSNEYKEYIESLEESYINGISYYRMTGLNLIHKVDEVVKPINSSSINLASLPKKMMQAENDYLKTGYDLLAGRFPEEKTELLLEIDSYHRIEKTLLEALGLDSTQEKIPFEELLGREIRVVLNQEFYQSMGTYFMINMDFMGMYESENTIPLKFVGIVKAKNDNAYAMATMQMESMMGASSMTAGVGRILYTNELMEEIIDKNKDSEIVQAQRKADYNVLTMEKLEESENGNQTKSSLLNYLGAEDVPVMIQIFTKDFEAKKEVLKHLDAYNAGKSEEEQVIYTDMAETVSSLSGDIMDAITIVLVAFSGISLVVSSIMIGIITYISVLERTKEIGILRALGARKKDITRVFNAETFIIGLLSGIIGIGIARLLIFPTNDILKELTTLENVAQLNPVHAVILVVISVVLTLIGGWIPAVVASHKDPVEALRSE